MAAKSVPRPHGVAKKNRYLVCAGWAAACSAASPGLSIGVGGRPEWVWVFQGERECSCETVSGRV